MTEERDNLGLHVDDIRNKEEEGGIGGLFRLMSDDFAVADALAASYDGEIMEKRLSIMAMPEDSPEELEFWEKYEKGLHKEIHGEGLDKWSAFVPLAAEKDPERRFPLIFCLHGAHNPIQMTECYGIIQVAAREECVVICPENENWASIERLYTIARALYPVDLSRVYCMGYSFGGFSSSRVGLAHPELFAGIGMGGMLFANDVAAHDLDGQWYEEYKLTDEMIEKVRNLGLGICLIMGEHEMLGLLPLSNMPGEETQNGVIPLKPDQKKVSFNNFRKAAGCTPAVFPEKDEAENEVEKLIGARFEETEIREFHGRRYMFGFSKNEAGECLLETVGVEGAVHWPASMYGEIFWAHLSRFARDRKTGRLIHL